MSRTFHLLNDARTFASLADNTLKRAEEHAANGELQLENAARNATTALSAYSDSLRDTAKELEARDAS